MLLTHQFIFHRKHVLQLIKQTFSLEVNTIELQNSMSTSNLWNRRDTYSQFQIIKLVHIFWIYSKATTLDRVYGPAWLAFGHAFAADNEHDQAMAAYFTASQLMKGCHLPILYIGLEYGLTNNSKLAERFFSQALSIAPEDPFVLHEMGVIAFQNNE